MAESFLQRMGRRPALLALLLQLLAVCAVLLLHRGLLLAGLAVPLVVLIGLQGTLAALLSWRCGQASWWWLIHLLFVPGLWLAAHWQVAPGWLLAALLLVLLLNWNSLGERVPLYLTGRRTERELQGLLADLPPTLRMVDLGCGLAGTLCRLAERYPQGQFVGVETAPLVFLLAWLRCLGRANCRVYYRSLWDEPLGDYDVAYCFLSPAPMPRLWQKVQAEMRPGSRLISNTFAIPGVPAQRVIELHDWRRSCLLLWQR